MTEIQYKNIPLFTKEPRYQLFLFLKDELLVTLKAMENHGVLESYLIHFDLTWNLIKKNTPSYYGIIQSLFNRNIVSVNDVRKDCGTSIPSIIKNLDDMERAGVVQKYVLGDLGEFGVYSKTFLYALRNISFDTVLSYAKENYEYKPIEEKKDFTKKQCTQCFTLYRKGKDECPQCGSIAYNEIKV